MHGDDGGHGCGGNHEGKQAVTKLDELVDPRRRAGQRNQRTRVALRPGDTAKARTSNADNSARYRDATLADEQNQCDEALLLNRGRRLAKERRYFITGIHVKKTTARVRSERNPSRWKPGKRQKSHLAFETEPTDRCKRRRPGPCDKDQQFLPRKHVVEGIVKRTCHSDRRNERKKPIIAETLGIHGPTDNTHENEPNEVRHREDHLGAQGSAEQQT